MAPHLSPGVYVLETPSAMQPIAGLGTSTAAFVGIVPDRIAIPGASPFYNPTLGPQAPIEAEPLPAALLGATLASDVKVQTAEATLPAGTILTEPQARAVKAAGGLVSISYVKALNEGGLLGKIMAADVVDPEGQVVRFTRSGAQIELRAGYEVRYGEAGLVKNALIAAGLTEVKLQETYNMAERPAQDLIGKTLGQDTAIAGSQTLPAGTLLADEEITATVIQAVRASGRKKIAIRNTPFLLSAFSPVAAGEPKLCTSFSEFRNSFGDFSSDGNQGKLAHGVYGFFANGGTRCYVMRFPALADLKAPAALNPLEVVNEISLVAAPGIADGQVDRNLLAHCAKMGDRFAILDSAEEIAGELSKENIAPPGASDYGAFYFPWIKVFDPAAKLMSPNGDGRVFIGPSGHLAGIYARVDNERGIHKAPANEVVRGALALKYPVSRATQNGLNPHGINCIREMNGNIRVWGARTIGGDANSQWKYINVRRLFLFLREAIDQGTQWVVFEPNTPDLRAKIRRNITAFLTGIWRDGALAGNAPGDAFYVKCDEMTNPPEVRAQGQVVAEIGVAVVKPAEFAIFRVSQWSGPGN